MSTCSTSQILYNDYILPISNSVAAISTIPLIYMYIKAYLQKEFKQTTLFFNLGMIFFVIIFVSFIMSIIRHLIFCHAEYYHFTNFMDLVCGILYTLQSAMLLFILFTRMIVIFKKTALALSRCVICILMSMIIAVAILSSFCAISFNLLEQYSPNSQWLIPIDLFRAFLSLSYLIRELKLTRLSRRRVLV